MARVQGVSAPFTSAAPSVAITPTAESLLHICLLLADTTQTVTSIDTDGGPAITATLIEGPVDNTVRAYHWYVADVPDGITSIRVNLSGSVSGDLHVVELSGREKIFPLYGSASAIGDSGQQLTAAIPLAPHADLSGWVGGTVAITTWTVSSQFVLDRAESKSAAEHVNDITDQAIGANFGSTGIATAFVAFLASFNAAGMFDGSYSEQPLSPGPI